MTNRNFLNDIKYSIWFEPRSYIWLCSLLVRFKESILLRWTAVVSGDWRFEIFSGSHHQSQLKSDEWNWLLNLMMTSAQVVRALVITTINIPGILSPRRLDFAITFKASYFVMKQPFFLLSISWRQKRSWLSDWPWLVIFTLRLKDWPTDCLTHRPTVRRTTLTEWRKNEKTDDSEI